MRLIQRLNETNSSVEKIAILKGITYDEWRTFMYAYSKDVVYHIKFDDYDMDNLGEPSKQMFNLIDEILNPSMPHSHRLIKINTFALDHGDLIKLVINKDLRCGVTAKTFNKAHHNSIPLFEVQLAKEVDIKKLSYPLFAQLKYDGVRLIALINNGEVTLKTRNGKIVDLPFLSQEIANLPFDNYILDGEITLAEGKSSERTSISGMINSAMHGGSIDESEVVYNVFDTMPLSEWNMCECHTPYDTRLTHVMSILSAEESKMLRLALTNEVHNAEGALQLYEAALALGYEGLILKPHKHLYTFKRSKDWVKVKEVKTADLHCYGTIAGTGKYEGMIGALVCKGTVEGREVTVNIGSGLSDMQRGMPPSVYVLQTIEVKYNSVIQDSKTGEWSLFLPRFVMVRYDK